MKYESRSCFARLMVPLSAARAVLHTTFPCSGHSRPATSRNLPIPTWGQEIIDSFSKPIHPVIGGIASGGGLGFGIGYDSPDDQRWYQEARSDGHHRRYWSLEGEVGRRSLSKCSQIGVFGAVRHMGRLDYFGIGPTQSSTDRSAFRLRETTFGSAWMVPPCSGSFDSAAAPSRYMPDLGTARRSPSVPSIEDGLSATSVPGIRRHEPTFGRYRGFAEFQHPVLARADTLDEPEPLSRHVSIGASRPSAITTRGGTTSTAGRRKSSSAFPASCLVSG